jgi:hypothetical protein
MSKIKSHKTISNETLSLEFVEGGGPPLNFKVGKPQWGVWMNYQFLKFFNG